MSSFFATFLTGFFAAALGVVDFLVVDPVLPAALAVAVALVLPPTDDSVALLGVAAAAVFVVGFFAAAAEARERLVTVKTGMIHALSPRLSIKPGRDKVRRR